MHFFAAPGTCEEPRARRQGLQEGGDGEPVRFERRGREGQGREEADGVGVAAVAGVGEEHGVEGEGGLVGDAVEEAAGEGEAAGAGVEGEELGGEEVPRDDAEEEEAGVELGGRAEEAAVREVLEEVAGDEDVDPLRKILWILFCSF